jgi:hypothetical protein
MSYRRYEAVKGFRGLPLACKGKGKATLEPEPTQHSKPTVVWVYIAETCGHI